MRFAADENFRGDILNGLLRSYPELDIVRVQDTEMYQADDQALLNWCAAENRILITHDVRTIPGFLNERVRLELPVPGVIEVAQGISAGQAIEELAVMLLAGNPADFENLVRYVPMR
jgi:hypothetical protein